MNDRTALTEIFSAAVSAVDAADATARAIGEFSLDGDLAVLGAGKAACAMASGAQAVLGERLVRGGLNMF